MMTVKNTSPKKKSKKSEDAGENRRSRAKFRALDPTLNLKTRYEEIEDLASYANTLPPEAREWLNSFSEEYICANFNHKGDKLHTTDEQRKSCYNRNNARNRCVFTKQKAQGEDNMDYLEDMGNKDFDNEEEIEDSNLLDPVEE